MSRTAPLSISLALLVAVAAPVHGFHDGGVAACSGCHVTHNSADGTPIVPGPGNDYALIAESPSDVCLSCHANALGAVLGVSPLAPPEEKGAGNFVFLLEDDLDDSGSPGVVPGEAAGHDLVAPGYGLDADFRYTTAPGGTFPSSELGCTSCHDPHGRDTFRMLYGAGPVQDGLAVFSAAAPAADGIALTPGLSESPTAHTAYRDGVSDWCGNCHGTYHQALGGEFEHPVDVILDTGSRDQYNRYDGIDNPTGGIQSTAYLPEVPLEDGGATTTSQSGAGPTSRLTCLSCHRAHASSGPAAGRWDFEVDRLGDDGVASGSWPIPNPYGNPDQPPLCWKCHPGGSGS